MPNPFYVIPEPMMFDLRLPESSSEGQELSKKV